MTATSRTPPSLTLRKYNTKEHNIETTRTGPVLGESLLTDVKNGWRKIKHGVSQEPEIADNENDEGTGESGLASSEKWDEWSGVDPVGYDPSNLGSQREIFTETGVEVDSFFCQIIREQSGWLPQKAFKDSTNLSSSTISRLLKEMENDGQVVRISIGREKLVCLPDHAPVDYTFPTGDTD